MCMLIGLLEINAQTISKQVIGSSGQSITNGTTTLNFTVGEPVVGLVNNISTISQGFWAQLVNDGTLSVSSYTEAEVQIGVYPNPVVDYLKLSFKNPSVQEFDVKLIDINGRTLINKIFQNNTSNTQLDMTRFSSGIYVLVVTTNDINYSKSIKIIKQ